jgi:hypothetical protein
VEEHTEHLNKVFTKLQEEGLFVKDSKMKLYQSSCKFLGHQLSADGIKPLKSKIAAIEQWPIPKCVSDIRQFLGLVGYYQKYIYKYTEKSKPLFNLLRKDIEFPTTLTDEQMKSFETLKTALITQPVLIIPDQESAHDGSRPYVVLTDCSGVGIGGVLMQDIGKGLQPVAYESRTLTPAESNYSAGDLELLALYHYTTCIR